jgi:hypothetical protein
MFFRNRDYHLMAQAAGTNVSGDASAMLRLQRSSARYFQRPDRGQGSNGLLSDRYDPSLTSLRGVGAYARLAREQGNLLWEVATNLRTPGFENNDIAFLSRADYWWTSANIFRQWTKPTTWYRQAYFIVGGQQQYNFDWDLTDRQGQVFGEVVLSNYWDVSGFWIARPSVFDDRLTRGGPVQKRPGVNFWQVSVASDRRKSVVVRGNGSYDRTSEGTSDWSTGVEVQLRPAANISLSFGPSYSHDFTGYQFVAVIPDPTAVAYGGQRYVFSDLAQNTLAMDTRFNVTFTPNLTFELFIQPLIASGSYSRYKEFAAPRSLAKVLYEDVGDVTVIPRTGRPDSIVIDPDGGGQAQTFSFSDPSFVFRALRGNAVLRWEYRPGSTLFLVWTRSSESALSRGTIDFGPDSRALFRGPAENIFLLKLNFWLGF